MRIRVRVGSQQHAMHVCMCVKSEQHEIRLCIETSSCIIFKHTEARTYTISETSYARML